MNKYNAKSLITNDGKFDSIGEYKCWLKLNALKNDVNENNRVINIERQVTYKFIVNQVLIGRYIADFVVTYANGSTDVFDFKNPYLLGKGRSTPTGSLFQYKKKLMKALHNIDIKIITQ